MDTCLEFNYDSLEYILIMDGKKHLFKYSKEDYIKGSKSNILTVNNIRKTNFNVAKLAYDSKFKK